jgi:hypothetical protein
MYTLDVHMIVIKKSTCLSGGAKMYVRDYPTSIGVILF